MRETTQAAKDQQDARDVLADVRDYLLRSDDEMARFHAQRLDGALMMLGDAPASPTSQAPVAGADPRAFDPEAARALGMSVENIARRLSASDGHDLLHSDLLRLFESAAALRDAAEAVTEARAWADKFAAQAQDAVSEAERAARAYDAAAARGAEGERGVEGLRQALSDVRGMVMFQSSDYARDAYARIDAALSGSAPRPSAGPAAGACGSTRDGFVCNRAAGHDGDHEERHPNGAAIGWHNVARASDDPAPTTEVEHG